MLWLAALAALGAPAAAAAAANTTDFTGLLLDRALKYVAGDAAWPARIAGCATALGPHKCISTFSAWRAENALQSFRDFGDSYSVLDKELTQFPWEKYTNATEEQVGEQLSEGTARLLELRPLTFTMIPGYQIQLDIKDGRINVDLHKDDKVEVGRGTMKKFRKRFLAIVPILLIPGLIMSAVLPFVLPALKMMTIGAGLLNNMAFTGAIFTLLRNNAFTSTHHKKIIYVNDGYKNEKYENSDFHTHTIEDGYFQEDEELRDATADVEHVEEAPEEWLAEYYGGEELAQAVPNRGPPYRGTRRSEPKKRKTRLKHGM